VQLVEQVVARRSLTSPNAHAGGTSDTADAVNPHASSNAKWSSTIHSGSGTAGPIAGHPP
jgi:hypothetical protein